MDELTICNRNRSPVKRSTKDPSPISRPVDDRNIISISPTNLKCVRPNERQYKLLNLTCKDFKKNCKVKDFERNSDNNKLWRTYKEDVEAGSGEHSKMQYNLKNDINSNNNGKSSCSSKHQKPSNSIEYIKHLNVEASNENGQDNDDFYGTSIKHHFNNSATNNRNKEMVKTLSNNVSILINEKNDIENKLADEEKYFKRIKECQVLEALTTPLFLRRQKTFNNDNTSNNQSTTDQVGFCNEINVLNFPIKKDDANETVEKQSEDDLIRYTIQCPFPVENLNRRRRTIASSGQTRKTYDEWLGGKKEEQRRRSLDIVQTKKVLELNSKLFRYSKFQRRKSYDEWLNDKASEEKKRQAKLMDIQNINKKIKSDKERLREEEAKRKYDEWVNKKYLSEIFEEERLIKKLKERVQK